MTFQDAVAYLHTLVNYEQHHQPKAMRRVRLSRMRELCRRLGEPQRRYRSVLVAGTNGKGSIAAMLYSCLRESRLRAGLYTSPHVEDLRERIRVSPAEGAGSGRRHGDDWIAPDDFAAAIEAVQPAIDELLRSSSEGPPTYFEAITAAAFWHFQRRGVAVAVLEVGLGGRYDATNAVEQTVSVFGPIDVDHADVLGATPAAIAAEKAGIIKPGQTALTVPQRADVLRVLQAACDTHAVPLIVCGRELTVRVLKHTVKGLRLSVTGLRGIYDELTLPLIGRHQAENAAAAIGALEALSTSGIPHHLVEGGLRRLHWPGRLEIVHREPLVLMDGGHNPHAAGALRQTLEELCAGRRVHLLIGTSSDKSVEGIGERLAGLPLNATCTMSRHPRALNPVALAERLGPYCSDIHVMSDPADAYTYLLNTVPPEDVIVVAGSFFMVAELRARLQRSHITSTRRAARASVAAA
ncbi:MAG: bifunctional folylpolyglutamate synthase/dihydrofolate synthase [Candidatus Omnitrophica bacterium]|nr:bifunctional folylpolyglutamate synthase/dihydrofolate synthase [Candidatus Omnitrophota bacterium]